MPLVVMRAPALVVRHAWAAQIVYA
jgi:hypothetical protein